MKLFRSIRKIYKHLTKQKNQVSYESVQKPMVEEPKPPVEEESDLEITIENPYVNQVREWAIKKIDLLHEADRHRNAKALSAEFDEWINIPEGTEELNYLCIENQDDSNA